MIGKRFKNKPGPSSVTGASLPEDSGEEAAANNDLFLPRDRKGHDKQC